MRRILRPASKHVDEPLEIPSVPHGVLQVCHPQWRGVRSSAIAFGDPVLEATDLGSLVDHIPDILASGASTVVIQGWPPSAARFATAASVGGLRVFTMFHSSPAQHGVDGGEAEAVTEMLELKEAGIVGGVATVKSGVARSMRSLGHDVTHVGNRVPVIDSVEPATVADGINVGIFLYPLWRKNVTTQILAAHLLEWRPFVMEDPQVPYLSRNDLTICGELPRDEFLPIQAAMDITFNVTLSECHPMLPMESYRLGVPCLMSRTSDLFIDNPVLHDLTTVDRADNPDAIAEAAERLLANSEEAVAMANTSLDTTDRKGADQWRAFTRE